MIHPNRQIDDTLCPEFGPDELAAFSEGLLPDDRHSALLNHLLICLSCQRELEFLIHESELTVQPAPRVDEAEAPDFLAFRAHLQTPSPPEVRLEIGDLVGPFKLLNKLGKGGSSTVFECMDQQMQRRVAVKVLNPRLFDDSSLARLEREARTLAQLDHPSILKAFEIRPYHFPPYIVMELVAGGPASHLLRNGPLPPHLAARLIAGVARAVQHAHEQGIVHRDIKPSNLLVVQAINPNSPLPADLSLKVSDFGLARPMAGDSRLTSTNAIIGTPAYMSPEQSRGRQAEVGTASDIYALGVVLYEFLIGRPPLVADNPMQTLRLINEVEPVSPRRIQPGIARDLETICMKCLRKDPAERYDSAKDLSGDLERFLEGRPILARPISPVGRVYRWCRRNRPLAAALGGIILLLAFVVALGVNYSILQNDLLRQAEENAQRERQVAIEIGHESDSFRNLVFSSFGKLSHISDELLKVQNTSDALLLRQKTLEMNRQGIKFYLERPYYRKELTGDFIDTYFRDALALRDIGFMDESVAMLTRLLAIASQAKPADKDYLRLISVGNRSAPVLGKIKIAQKKTDEATDIMIKAFVSFRIPPNYPGLQPIHQIERYGLLITLMKDLESQNPIPYTDQIKAEIDSFHKTQLEINTIPKMPKLDLPK
jgi:serine/threonine protein kinase